MTISMTFVVVAIWFAAAMCAVTSFVSLVSGFFPAMKNGNTDEAARAGAWFICSTISALALSAAAAGIMGI